MFTSVNRNSTVLNWRDLGWKSRTPSTFWMEAKRPPWVGFLFSTSATFTVEYHSIFLGMIKDFFGWINHNSSVHLFFHPSTLLNIIINFRHKFLLYKPSLATQAELRLYTREEITELRVMTKHISQSRKYQNGTNTQLYFFFSFGVNNKIHNREENSCP